MNQESIKPGFGARPGDFVSIRSCVPEHGDATRLGIYVGDVAPMWREGGQLRAAMPNPCIWVPDLEEYVFGCESWWGRIETEDDLRQITDQDIENVWYVRALKALSTSPEVWEGGHGN